LKLSEWASIAEVLSAIAIVVSLVFVGLQISEGNRQTRAATVQSDLDSEMEFQAEITRYADTWVKVINGIRFSDEVETRRALILYNMAMTQNENQFEQMSSGYLEFNADAIDPPATWPIYEMWTQTTAYRGRSVAFRDFLETERKRRIAENDGINSSNTPGR